MACASHANGKNTVRYICQKKLSSPKLFPGTLFIPLSEIKETAVRVHVSYTLKRRSFLSRNFFFSFYTLNVWKRFTPVPIYLYLGLRLAWVSLSHFAQYPFNQSFCSLYFFFVLVAILMCPIKLINNKTNSKQ